MKNLWENLGDQIKTWTDTAAEKAVVITRAAATKAEELSKIGKLKMDIYQLRRERGRLFADLGQIAYQTLDGKSKGTLESQPGVDDLRRRLASLTGRIKEKEVELVQASHLGEPVHDAAPPEGKAVPKKEAPATTPSKAKTAPKKDTTATRPGGAKKGSGRKKTTTTTKKTGPKKTTKGTSTS